MKRLIQPWSRYTGVSLIGVILIIAAVIVFIDAAMVAAFSARLIGAAAITVGVFEVINGLGAGSRGRSMPRCALGLLYIAFGLGFLGHAEFRNVLLTYVLAVSLIVSGGVRIAIGNGVQSGSRWLMLSGLVGVAAGLSIFFAWPDASLRTIARALATDLLVHGLAWLMVARRNELAGRRSLA